MKKNVPCAFLNSTLEKELRTLNIHEIVLVGVATNNSIEATARTGGNIGFKVYVVDEACFTFDKLDYHGVPRTPSELHSMSLANLNGEYATVLSCEQLLSKTKI